MPSVLAGAIRDTIQSLYNVMLHTSAYDAAGPHTTLDALVAEVHVLSKALQGVAHTAAGGNTPSGQPLPSVPRDLLQYVEAGRNPDIYTREFVELVRRTNQLRAGKRAAFGQFRDVLAGQIRSALPELRPDVDAIVESTGAEGGGSSGGPRLAPKPTAPAPAPAPAATLPTRSLSASASVSPPIGHTGGDGTPGSDGGSGAIDMLGLLPGTPQPGGVPTTTAATAGAGVSFASTAGGGVDGKPDGGGMQT